jgi:hypothetical protein
MRKVLFDRIIKEKEIEDKENPLQIVTRETKNSFEGMGNQTQVGDMGQGRQGEREPEEKETNKTMEKQNPQETFGNDKVSTGEGNRDTNTPMQEGDGDSEMTPSEVGTEDPDLRDIIEREGIDLQNILEQWKKQGMDNIPSEQLDRIQYLFLMREEEKTRGIKHMHGEIGTLGIKAGDSQQQHSPKKAKRKKGRKYNSVALQELGALLINSGKIKKFFPTSPPNV